MRRRSSLILKPRRSATAAEGIALLKRGAPAIKHGRDNKERAVTFRLDEEEQTLSWDGSLFGKVMRPEKRAIKFDDVLELHVGRLEDTTPDPLALERTEAAFQPKSPSKTPAAGPSDDKAHLILSFLLVGALPTPPSLDGGEGPSSARGSATTAAGRFFGGFSGRSTIEPPPIAERASLVLQCPDEEALGLWLAALRALLAERLPPSPIGPAALQGAFGCDLEEVALADASLSAGLLVPAVLEALWVALQDALGTEGIFRVSAAESEVAAVRQRLQEGDETERALDEASPACVAALIKLYLREVPRELWAPVGGPLAELLHAAGADAAALGEGMRGLLPQLPRRSADLVVWVCDVMLAVVAREADNRMGRGAIAAVLAPVLMRGGTAEPAPAAARRAQNVAMSWPAGGGSAAASAGAGGAAQETAALDPMAALAAAKRGVQLTEALLAAHARARLTRASAAGGGRGVPQAQLERTRIAEE